jgi:hypothetical protein
MAKDDDTFTAQLLKYADKAVKSVSKAYDKTMGMPEEIAQQTYDYVIAQGGTEEQARGIAGRLASKAGRTTGAIDFMLPQSASDVAFMAAGPLGPATKAGKAALAAGSGLMVMDPSDAEAGPLTKMRKGLENFMEGSVLREKDGDPTRLYHGSKSDIKYFDTNHPDRKDTGWMGRGVYAFDSPAGANLYAMTKRGPVGENITPLYGRLTNPYEFTMAEKKAMSSWDQSKVDDFTNELVRKGHDGAILKYPDGTREVAIYDPKMVKSAIGNTGDYDMTTDLLTKRAGGAVKGYAVGGDVTDEGLKKLYVDYFGREADEDGLKYWGDTAAQQNLSLSDIGDQFARSKEFEDQFAGPGASKNKFAPTSDPSEWTTYWGYKPTQKDYMMLLRSGLGEYGQSDYNQYRGVYEALGNRAAMNTLTSDYGGSNNISNLITPSQVEGAFATKRINSLLNSSNPQDIEAVASARKALDDYLREGQNKVITTQTDWRGFTPTGNPSPGVTRTGEPFTGRFVPGSEDVLSRYNTFYDAELRPDITAKLADLQNQRNAIWRAPLPASRPTDDVLVAENPETYQAANTVVAGTEPTLRDEDGRSYTESDGARRYMTFEPNPFDTNGAVGGVQTANVDQNINDTTGEDYNYTFIPNVTPGANTGLGFSTYDPNSFQVYRDQMIDQNAIQQNQLATNASNWQQDFNNVVGGQFNMSNPGLVGGYNSSNIGGFDYSGLGNSLGNVGATSGFGLNTGWDFGGGWGFADGGEVKFKEMFEGDSEAMQERARELAREAYSKGYSSLGKKKAEEWEALASKYNLPLSVGPFDNYEDQYSDAVSKWQRGLSPKQRVQTYAEGGVVTPYDAEEIATLANKIYEGTNG